MADWLNYAATIGMAVGPPLVYADQTYSIVRKKDATGFSRDVCAILLFANITRCFYWIGNHFETPLLIQAILMILAQLILLYICILYRPVTSPETLGTSTRPFKFWQWPSYIQYLEALIAYITVLAILILIFRRFTVFVEMLGFLALGLESTLPIPQLISNYKQRSLYGFRMSTLVGWAGGDAFKTAYFFIKESPLPFKVCSIFQLSIDCLIVIQRIIYGNAPPEMTLLAQDDEGLDELEEALALADD